MEEQRTKKKWCARRWLVIAAILVIVPGGLEIGLSKFLAYELRQNVSQHLDAELSLSGVWYVPPLSLHVAHASLDRDGEQLMKIGPSVFTLGRIPLPGHPIEIQSIDIEQPSVELVKDEQGIWGGENFVKKTPPALRQAHHVPKKLSEILRLRHLRIHGARISYTDLRDVHPLTMTWGDINMDVALQQKSTQVYGFRLGAQTAQLADLSLAGTLDVDTLALQLNKMGIKVDADAVSAESALPAPVQRIVRKYGVTGQISIDGQATVPLTKISDLTYTGTISVDQATARLPQIGLALDQAAAKIQVQQITGPASAPSTQEVSATSPVLSRPKLMVTVQSFEGQAGGARFVLDQARVSVDPVAKEWVVSKTSGHLLMMQPKAAPGAVRQRLLVRYAPEGRVTFSIQGRGPLQFSSAALKHADYQILAYPRDISIRVPNFPHRFEGIGGEVRAAHGIISLANFQATYGNDQYRLKAARVPVDPLPKEVQVREITAFAHLSKEPTEYSPPVMKYLKIAQPNGTVAVAGMVNLDLNKRPIRPDFDLQASTDHAGVVITQANMTVPVQNIHMDAFLTPQNIRCPDLHADLLDGRLEASGEFHPQVSSYDGKYDLRRAHLERVKEILDQAGAKPPQVSGELSTSGTFSGILEKGHSPLDGLNAEGVLQVIHGDFFRLPIFSSLLNAAHFSKGIGTVGELATSYNVGRKTIAVKNCAINSPLVGVQVNGTIGFDGTLNLQAILAPLADWRDKINKTNIPLLSNIAGQIAGSVQKLVNTATSKLLYQFRVEGRVKDPKVIPVPAPALTDAAAFVFGKMVQGVKDGQLLNAVQQASTSAPSSQPVR